MTTRVSSLVLLVVFAVLGPMLGTSEATHPGERPRNDAVLYELMEHAVFTDGLRVATAALEGKARLGSALCPEGLQAHARAFYAMFDINVRLTARCTVVAIGESRIRVDDGSGRIDGEFWIVVNSDATSNTDSQELVIMSGIFTGTVQVTDPQALIIEVLPGSSFEPKGVLPGFALPPAVTFRGTFRRPFTVHHIDVYQTDRGRLVPVQADERALGDPTVRLEVSFD